MEVKNIQTAVYNGARTVYNIYYMPTQIPVACTGPATNMMFLARNGVAAGRAYLLCAPYGNVFSMLHPAAGPH